MSGSADEFRTGVIIGPGGGQSSKCPWSLKVLQENNIPIDHIVGLGWGGLGLPLLLRRTKMWDEVKWSFYKLLKRGFFKRSFLNSPFQSKDISKMNAELEENFDSNQKTVIPFSCPAASKNGVYAWHTQNKLKTAVKNCLLLPPFFKSSKDSTGSLFAVRKARKYLKKKNIILLSLLIPWRGAGFLTKNQSPRPHSGFYGGRASAYFREIEEDGKLISAPINLKNFSLKDFSKMDLIILEGRKEGLFLVNKLRSLYPRLALLRVLSFKIL